MVTTPLLLTVTLLAGVGQVEELRGTQAGERLGATLVCAPDLDHGGVAVGPNGPFELLIGAPGWDGPGAEDAGAVIWVPDLAAVAAQPGSFLYLDAASVPTAYASAFEGERLGSSLDYGDVDGDDRSELFLGAPAYNWTDVPNLSGLGRALLMPGGGAGAAWAEDPTDHAALILEIGQAHGPVEAQLGASVVLYDADGDGRDDLLAAAPRLPVDELLTLPNSIGTGYAAWIDADDVDLVGPQTVLDVRDVAAGFVAGDGDTAGDIDRIQRIDNVDGAAGHELAVIDLEPPLSDDDPGAVYVFYSGTTAYPAMTFATDGWLALIPETANDELGRSLAFGDVTGDGELDLLVGAPGWRGKGALAIFPGPLDDAVELHLATDAIVLEGKAEGSQLGWALGQADIDGDGVHDMVIGAPAWDAQGEETASEALIVFGGPALAQAAGTVIDVETVVRFRFEGDPRDGMGAAICGPGDIDGDGLVDVVVAAPDATPASGLDGAGRVWLGLSSGAPDEDGDGVSAVFDCDDGDATVHPARPDDPKKYPAAPEICDDKDNDCDGLLHPYELDVDGDGARVCDGDCLDDPHGGAEANLLDADGDGYNTCGVDPSTIQPGEDLANFTLLQTDPTLVDCDDTDPEMFPFNPADDLCDEKDNDCDGTTDEDGEQDLYVDLDHDGYGSSETSHVCWSADFAEQSGDCNDLDPEIHPGAEDPPNDGIDQDCDGSDFLGGQPCVCTKSGHRAAAPAGVGALLVAILSLVLRRSGRR